ncbi:MAG TPA: hypothetical protein VJB59_10460 [Bdellovibrionota bacterium]|nr:hypothetical protein [Bdellovibrionota bacterium]
MKSQCNFLSLLGCGARNRGGLPFKIARASIAGGYAIEAMCEVKLTVLAWFRKTATEGDHSGE